jgi:cytochrome c556
LFISSTGTFKQIWLIPKLSLLVESGGVTMKQILIIAILGLSLTLFGALGLNVAAAAADGHGLIKKRIELMRKDVLGNFKVIIGFVKRGEGSMADVEKASNDIQTAAGKIPALFPKGTGRPDVDDKTTRSLSKIWEDWGTFETAAKAMGAHAGHVAMSAGQGNADEVKKYFGLMGKEGCGACHKPFRGPKAKN